MNDYQRDRVRKLAARALHHATRGHFDAASRAVQQLNDQHGPDAVDLAVLAWIDTLAARLGITGDRPVAITFQNAETGAIGSADDVPAEVAWAGQLINARFQLDQDTYRALIAALPDDPKVIGDHLGRVLQCIALMLARPQP